MPDGLIDERRAHRLMPEAIREQKEKLYREASSSLDSFEHVLFDEAIDAFLEYQETEKRVKPSTLLNNRGLLARPTGKPKQRGARTMRFFGGRELFRILTTDIRKFLAARQGLVIDVKGEYEPLCRSFGVRPFRMEPGGDQQLNAIDRRLGRDGQLSVLRSVARAVLIRG